MLVHKGKKEGQIMVYWGFMVYLWFIIKLFCQWKWINTLRYSLIRVGPILQLSPFMAGLNFCAVDVCRPQLDNESASFIYTFSYTARLVGAGV